MNKSIIGLRIEKKQGHPSLVGYLVGFLGERVSKPKHNWLRTISQEICLIDPMLTVFAQTSPQSSKVA